MPWHEGMERNLGKHRNYPKNMIKLMEILEAAERPLFMSEIWERVEDQENWNYMGLNAALHRLAFKGIVERRKMPRYGYTNNLKQKAEHILTHHYQYRLNDEYRDA